MRRPAGFAIAPKTLPIPSRSRTPLSTSAFLDRLLEPEAQALWFRWNRHRSQLIRALPQSPDNLRVLWLLDGLTPLDDPDAFENRRGHWYGLYAWGRRLPPHRRRELLSIPVAESIQVEVAVAAAWCESCPADQLLSLLDSPRVHWGLDPLDDLNHREPDATDGRTFGRKRKPVLTGTCGGGRWPTTCAATHGPFQSHPLTPTERWLGSSRMLPITSCGNSPAVTQPINSTSPGAPGYSAISRAIGADSLTTPTIASTRAS